MSKSKLAAASVRSSFQRSPVSSASRYSISRSAPVSPALGLPARVASNSLRHSSAVSARRTMHRSVCAFILFTKATGDSLARRSDTIHLQNCLKAPISISSLSRVIAHSGFAWPICACSSFSGAAVGAGENEPGRHSTQR